MKRFQDALGKMLKDRISKAAIELREKVSSINNLSVIDRRIKACEGNSPRTRFGII